MQNFVRITILCVCIAVGVTVAVSLAMQPPPSAPEKNARDPSSFPSTISIRKKASPEVPAPVAAVDHTAPPTNPLFAPQPPVIAPYQSAITQQVQDLKEELRDVKKQQSKSELDFLKYATDLIKSQSGSALSGDGKSITANDLRKLIDPKPAAAEETSTQPSLSSPASVTDIHRGEGDNELELNLRDSDLRQVLDMLSEQTGLNILPSPNVKGTVTATLKGVDARSALKAILKSTGFVERTEGNFIYIGTPEDIYGIENAKERITTRIYYPNYVKAAELQALVAPILTPSVGKVSVCSPAEIDIPADNTHTGGDSFAGGEVLLIRDYEAVLWQVDQIIQDVDKRPRQVSIEAMIISVQLSDQFKFGVDFDLLRNQPNLRLNINSPLNSLNAINNTGGGLNFGFLDSSLGVFINALETIGDTNVVASPRLLCLNKQKAEILIGSKLGYVSTTVTQTSSTQTVNFLEVGTQLRIRPYIYSDGSIRMEVHPELSTGNVRVSDGLTLPDKDVTEVTTNIMCRDGNTIVIGGLIREELADTTTQVPWLGALPWVGPLFRHKTEKIDRRELIVLITPRIVCDPGAAAEGERLTGEFLNRQGIYADKMSPIGKRHFGERYLRLARAAWAAGDAPNAFRYTNLAIHFDELNRDATNLREEIIRVNPQFDASIDRRLRAGLYPGSNPRKDYSRRGFPWQPGPAPDEGAPVVDSYDPGPPSSARTVEPMTLQDAFRAGKGPVATPPILQSPAGG